MKPSITHLGFTSLLLAQLSSAVSLACDNIRVDGKKFDFSKLGGRHSVWVHDTARPPAEYNTTWTIDLCQPLKKIDGVRDQDQCPSGTRVCGIVQSWNPADDPEKKHIEIENVIPVAGNFDASTGQNLNPKFTRLKALDADSDGVRIELHGGTYDKKRQQAVIEMQCDREDKTSDARTRKRDDEEEGRDKDEDEDDKPSDGPLTYVSYGPADGKERLQVLRLNWKTKYACEDYTEDEGGKKTGWGFFTWFILIAFLGIAAYLIFGSWLNYNRYGARGWDLLPHGDTIRDIPYLVKDLSRKVVDTVSGSGSRGGYSAV